MQIRGGEWHVTPLKAEEAHIYSFLEEKFCKQKQPEVLLLKSLTQSQEEEIPSYTADLQCGICPQICGRGLTA